MTECTVTSGFRMAYVPPPGPPLNLTASPGTSSGQINLAWSAALPQPGTTIASYTIYRQFQGNWPPIATITGTSFSDTGLTPSNSYSYYVIATASNGAVSIPSNIATAIAPSVSPDVTAPVTPPQPTLLYQSVPNSSGGSYLIGWPHSVDPDPGLGATVSGTKNYTVFLSGAAQPPISDTAPIASPLLGVIGTNSGGSLMTGSDNGNVMTATSFTGDSGATLTADEFIYTSSIARGPVVVAMHITAETLVGPFSKRGVEIRASIAPNSVYYNMLSFGPAQGLKGEQRTAAGSSATGGVQVTFPGYPFWVRLSLDANGVLTRDYSTNSVTGALGDGTWTVYDTQTPNFGPAFLIGRFADPDTSGGTGGTISCTFDKYYVSGLAGLTFAGSGTLGSTISATVNAADNAGNVSPQSPPVTISINAQSGSALGFPVMGVWAAQPSTNAAYLAGLAKYNFVSWSYNIPQAAFIPVAGSMGVAKSNAGANGNPWYRNIIYNISNEWWPSIGSTNAFNNALISQLNSVTTGGLWWLTSTFPTLTQVTSQDNDNRKACNISDTTAVVNIPTLGSVTGPGNVNYQQFNAWLWAQQNVLGNCHAINASDPNIPANPYVGGTAIDNQEIGCPYVSGNWLNTTTFYSCSAGQLIQAVQPATQHGYAQYIDMMRATVPTAADGSEFLILGNIDGYNFGSGAPYQTSIKNKYDLTMAEDPCGRFEQNGGAVFANLLSALAAMESFCLRPGLNHFGVFLMETQSFTGQNPNPFPSNQSSWTAANYQAARYQMSVAALLRWVFMFSNPVSSTNLWFFDELLGGPTQIFQWLGQPIGPRILTPLSDGTYQADFANGSLRINPKGNGGKTINMPYSGHFIQTAGFGDATYNTGAAFTTVTTRGLLDRDAIWFKNT